MVLVEQQSPSPGILTLPAGRRLLIPVCVLGAALLFLTRLQAPLLEPEEALYAEVPREMAVAGSWLVPVHRDRPYYEKPPLFSWLIMLSYGVFGVNEGAARLVPCIAALATVLVTYWWGRRMFGSRAGLAGAAILCLSPRFIHQARMITMDGLLCLCVTAALALGQQALQGGRIRWRCWLLSALACGLGLLTKGPTALVLTALPLFLYALFERRSWKSCSQQAAAYLVISSVVALPWYAAVTWRDPAFLREFFWTHHVLMRFVQPLHEEPVWFYLPVLPLGMLPWSLLLPDLVRWRRSSPKLPPEVRFLLLCSLWCLAFFSVADCKRIGYVLPAMPPLALALGVALDRRLNQGIAFPFWATQGVLATGVGGTWLAVDSEFLNLPSAMALGGTAVFAMAWLFRRRGRQTSQEAWLTCALTTFALLLVAVLFVSPGYYRRFSMADEMHTVLGNADLRQLPVACYPHHWDSIGFYLRREDVRVYDRPSRPQLLADLDRQDTLVFVKTGKALDELLANLPPDLNFVPFGQARTVTAGLVQRRELLATTDQRPLSSAWKNRR